MRAYLCLLLLATAMAAAQPSPLMQEYNRAWQLTGQLKPDEAIPILKGIIAKDKTFYRAYHGLVEAYAQKKELGQAREYFHSLITEDPNNALAYYGLAELEGAAQDYPEEVRNYRECLKRGLHLPVCYSISSLPFPLSAGSAALANEFQKLLPAVPGDPFLYLGLSEVLWSRGKRQEACSAGEEGLTKLNGTKQPEVRAAFLEMRLGCPDQSEAKLIHAKEAYEIKKGLGDWESEMHATNTLAVAYLSNGQFEDGLALLERLLDVLRQLGHRPGEAFGLVALSNLYRFHGDLDTAIVFGLKAKQVWDEIGESARSIGELYEIEKIYREQGRLKEAGSLLEDLAVLAARAGDRRLHAFVLTDQGYVYAELGDYFKAIQFERDSIAMFQSLGIPSQAGAGLGMLAIHYTSLGDYNTALEYYQRSIESARRFQDDEEVKRNLFNLGDAYLRMDRPRKALAALNESRRIKSTFPWFNSRVLVNMGRAYLRLGQLQKAREHFEEAAREAHSLGSTRYEGEALVGLGEVHLHQGQLVEARRVFRQSLELGEKTGLAYLTVAARQGLGETAARQREYEEARREFAAAIENVESVRELVPDPELRIGLVQQNGAVYEGMINALYALHLQDRSKGYDRQAFDYAERGRARSFLEMLSEARARVSKGLSAEQTQQHEKLSAAVSKASRDLLASGTEASNRSLQRAETALSGWLEELRASNPRFRNLHYPQPYTAGQAQAEICRPGVVILEYALGEKQSFLWAMSGSRLEMAVLPGRRAVEASVTAYRRSISRPPKGESAFEADSVAARTLYDMLVRPAQTLLKPGSKVLVVPDGILYYLPFEALRSSATGHYFVEDFSLAYVPSASVYASLRVSASGQPQKELLAFGDPVFGRNTREIALPAANAVRSVYERGGWHLAPLPNTRREVEEISQLYPTNERKTYLGPAATESAVKAENLTDYRRIHFATHAIVDERIPARSGVVLSLVNTGKEDGVLRMPEIFDLEMDADLVVLSACQTGLGKYVRGEGMVGLTRAFLYAGARRVAVSLWEVNDLATADFMKTFYENMKVAPPAASLRAAKLAMIHSTSPAYRHPYYWAPFVLTGSF